MIDLEQHSYRQLRETYAERTQSVVAWIGAGFSAPAGLPTWNALRAILHEEGIRNANSFADEQEKQDRVTALNRIAKIPNMWVGFEKLKATIGPTTFSSIVQRALAVKDGQRCPTIYNLLWHLKLGGVLSLNLDHLATTSFSEVNNAKSLLEFTGKSVGEHLYVLKSPAPFLVYLHGKLDDRSTWVFTQDELQNLLRNTAYRAFITAVFSSRTVLFLGISADDIATNYFLKALAEAGANPGPAYWITDRTDVETERWAEENNVLIIRYQNDMSDHREVIIALKDLASYIPPDEDDAPVVSPPVTASSEILPSDELASKTPETIRWMLNAHAAEILSAADTDKARRYTEFWNEYELPIHTSWHVSMSPPHNVLFGHRIVELVGKGAFGKVYKAIGGDGRVVAIKTLQPDVQYNYKMLASFRRGVQAMKILSEHGINGMVPFREAYELPACVIMDFIEGQNLETAVAKGLVDDWRQRLSVAKNIIGITRSGHLLPERVLHRDLRPANIMLCNFDTVAQEWKVVVLDFDLSWHRDAIEESIIPSGTTALAYLAPEQLRSDPAASTRSALVDSFGCAMTLYYMCARQHPIQGDYVSQNWSKKVITACRRSPNPNWVSLPIRIARLIIAATNEEQSMRPDMSTVENEIQRLSDLERNPASVNSAELVADEILNRVFDPEIYRWNQDNFQGTVALPNGLRLTLQGDEVRNQIRLIINWQSTGANTRTLKFLHSDLRNAEAALRQSRWKVDLTSEDADALTLNARVNVKDAIEDIQSAATALRRAVDHISPK